MYLLSCGFKGTRSRRVNAMLSRLVQKAEDQRRRTSLGVHSTCLQTRKLRAQSQVVCNMTGGADLLQAPEAHGVAYDLLGSSGGQELAILHRALFNT